MKRGDATSQTQGTILLVAITLILFAILLPILLGFLHLPEFKIRMIPEIFIITNIVHIDDVTGAMNYDSRMIILHTGSITYDNSKLKARLYRNDVPLDCVIETLRATDFMSTVHLGVQWIGKEGCSGNTWLPGERGVIDVKDGTFHPGDTARIDIIDKSTGEVISRHSYHVV
jgi:hypothetical protein